VRAAANSVARVGDYMPLLRALASLDPPLFIFGGIAETVLLDGGLRPSHGDVDILIRRDEFELRTGQLGELGFHDFAVYYEPRPARPLVLGSSRDDVAVELNMLDHDAAGSPYFAVRTEEGPVSISVPGDLFDWPATIIDGVPIRTLSPLALIQIRAGLTATRVFGPLRPGKDDVQQARLIEAFFPDVSEESLKPRIASIADHNPVQKGSP
jgi:hypothetical protein